MGDSPNNETLRQMLTGFNGMQAALGLLPPQLGSPSVGLGPSVISQPPPPPVPHPSEIAIQAQQQQQAMMQQTMQAAQMTRYAPPPSAPTPAVSGFGWGGAMGQMASQQLNPFAAAGLSGNGYGMPNPAMMTSPSFGMFRPGGGGPMGMGGGRMPSIFNPFAPTMPNAHFMSPHMQSLQMMQAGQSQMLGMMSGVGEFGMGMGGAAVGGALGSMLGPLGTMGGAWLGSKIGHGISNMAFGPAMHDIAQGRMIQQMTAPFMVAGSNLSASGQGLSTGSAQQVSRGIHHLWRDREFERTGFNTADATRIMNLSGQQGLLTGAQTPDDIVRRVKDISKSVKVLMQITGDPDVQSAIASLGQMRNLGFQGLGAQTGAIANRAAFARMAGVSQAAMHDMFGMPGAMMAQQVGLSGATGYNAGMAGGALANIGASSGALNDLQLARAGGRSGLAQINTMAQISAMQSDVHLMASLKRGSKGLEVDMDAYRRAQKMDIGEVAKEAAERTRQMGEQGIFEWRTRRQEFKDQIAQKLTPLEMNLNVLRQAQGLQRQVPGMNLGSAIFSTVQSNAVGAGMGEAEAEQTARALELQFSSRQYWSGQKQQLMAQRRQAFDQERAQWAQYDTPGLISRTKRGFKHMMGDIGDAIASPFRRIADHQRRVGEDEEAAKYGEHYRRISEMSIAHDPEERRMMMEALRDQQFQQAYARGGGGDPLGAGTGNRMLNRIGGFLGISSTSGANRAVSLASESRGTPFGWHPFGSFGSTQAAIERINDVSGAARSIRMAETFDGTKRKAMLEKVGASSGGSNVEATLSEATSNLARKLDDLSAGRSTAGAIAGFALGGIAGGLIGGSSGSATALSREDIKKAYVDAAVSKGQDRTTAEKTFDANPDAISADMLKTVMATGTRKQKEVLGKSMDIATRAGAVDFTSSREALREDIRGKLAAAGIDSGTGDETLTKLGSMMAHHGADEVAVAAALQASTSDDEDERKRGLAELEGMRKRLGDEKFGKLKDSARETILKSADGKTREALIQMTKSGDVTSNVSLVKKALGSKKAGAAMDALMEHIGKAGSDKSLAGMDDPMEAVKKLTDADLDAMDDQELAKLFRQAKGGDREALNKAAARVAPTSRETRYGGSSAMDRQIAEIDAAMASIPEGGAIDETTKSKVEATTTTLFADSVKTFAQAVKELKGESEKGALSLANPWLQSLRGGT